MFMGVIKKYSNNRKILYLTLLSFLGAFIYFQLLTGKIIFSLIIGSLTIFLTPYYKKILLKRKKDRILLEFQDFIYFLDGALKAGKSLDNSLIEAKTNLVGVYGEDTILGYELEKVIYWNKLGITYDKGFQMLEEDYPIGFFREFGNVINITRNKGGDFKKVLEQTNSTLSDRMEVEREINTLLAKQKLEVVILRVIPFLMLLALRFLYPEMIMFLTSNMIGLITFLIVGTLFGLSFFISNKLMEVVWE